LDNFLRDYIRKEGNFLQDGNYHLDSDPDTEGKLGFSEPGSLDKLEELDGLDELASGRPGGLKKITQLLL
jgi:hypothetical protein